MSDIQLFAQIAALPQNLKKDVEDFKKYMEREIEKTLTRRVTYKISATHGKKNLIS